MHSQVRCGSEAGHVEAEHFDSFFMRSWDDDDARETLHDGDTRIVLTSAEDAFAAWLVA
jgi:hypothetical protein